MKKVIRRNGLHLVNLLLYSRSELRGITILGLIILAVILINSLLPLKTWYPPVDFRDIGVEAGRFEEAWLAAQAAEKSRGPNYRYYHNSSSRINRPDSSVAQMQAKKNTVIIDLNLADTFDLQQLRGIGPAFARRIVGYRERLHGFVRKEQLLEVFGMDSARYRSIEEHLTVSFDSIKPFDINNVTFKELLRHPYFPFQLTKSIMLYRQKKKSIRSLDELRSIGGVDDSVFRSISVYLRVIP